MTTAYQTMKLANVLESITKKFDAAKYFLDEMEETKFNSDV